MTRLRRLLFVGALAALAPLAQPDFVGSAVQDAAPVAVTQPSSLYAGKQRDPKEIYAQLEVLKRLMGRGLAVQSGSSSYAYSLSGDGRYLLQTTPARGVTVAESGDLWAPAAPRPSQSGVATLPGGGFLSPNAAPPVHFSVGARTPEIEGVHLPGVGLVLTLQLSQSDRLLQLRTPSPAPRPIDAWERVQQEIDGVPEKKADVKTPPPPPELPLKDQLVNRVLALLGAHGQRLTGLGEGERVIVVFTLTDGSGRSFFTTSGQNPLGSDPSLAYVNTTAPSPAALYGQNPVRGQATTATPAGSLSIDSNVTAQEDPTAKGDGAERQMKVGELHLRQGRYEEAQAAYRQAAELLARAGSTERRADAVTRWAGVLAAQGKTDEARKLLSEAAELQKAAGRSKAATAAPAAKPQKLIVSVTRQQLQLAGALQLDEADRMERLAEYLRSRCTVDVIDQPLAKAPAPALDFAPLAPAMVPSSAPAAVRR